MSDEDKLDNFRVLKFGDDSVIDGDARNLDANLEHFQRYKIIYADPPWKYSDQRKIRKDGRTPTRGIGACHHYGLMTMTDICAVPVYKLADDRCHLYMWATMPLLPDALSVMKAWRFSWATVAYVWVKLNTRMVTHKLDKLFAMLSSLGLIRFMSKLIFKGPGFYTMSNVELVLLGIKERPSKSNPLRFVRTRPLKHADGMKDSQVVVWPRSKQHSRKPSVFADSIVHMYPHAIPRLELFSRSYNAGWDHFGNELISQDGNLLEYGEKVGESWQAVR